MVGGRKLLVLHYIADKVFVALYSSGNGSGSLQLVQYIILKKYPYSVSTFQRQKTIC